jgi:hypothetical protein
MSKSKNFAVGKFIDASFQRKGEKHADRFLILLPHEIVHDKDFPFKTNLEPVIVKLENGTLIIKKIEG